MAPLHLALVLFMVGLYFVPAIIAWHKRSFWPVTAINFFLGWTFVGWVIALVWAVKDDR